MNLACIIALDTPEAGGNRLMAKMLAMSLIRSHFDGDILIFRSSAVPIFHLPRPGVVEVQLPGNSERLTGKRLAEEAWSWMYRVAGAVAEHADAIQAEKILYLDSDILCLRNPDHLLEGDWDIGSVRGPGRSFSERFYAAYLSGEELARLSGRPPLNAGTFAVRRECYREVMGEWAAIHEGPPPERNENPCDQCAWNREMAQSVLHTDLTQAWAKSFAPDESLIGTQLSLMGYPLNVRALPADMTWNRWPKNHRSHPETFDFVGEELLVQLLAAPHFFARKFSPESNIRECRLHLPGPAVVPVPRSVAPLALLEPDM